MLRHVMLVLAVTGPLAVPASGATPAQTCQSSKNKTAAKYASCRQQAEAKYATTGDGAARTVALQKCLDKYNRQWPLLETKAVKAGGVCPSVGDQAAIQGVIDVHTTNVATALAGGGLSNCSADLATCQGDLATCQAEPQGQRLQTGQIQCWNSSGTVIACAGTGQDGELQKGLARAYTDNGDGTITDDKTGLMWEKLSDDGSIHDRDTVYTWDNAFAVKVAGLNSGSFAGHTDWRLPNVNELQSIVNYQNFSPAVSPAFNSSCAPGCTVTTCSCTVSAFYWSSSTYAGYPPGAWDVYFFDGGVFAGYKSDGYYVRAVRGGS